MSLLDEESFIEVDDDTYELGEEDEDALLAGVETCLQEENWGHETQISCRQHDNLISSEESANLTNTAEVSIEQEPIDHIHGFKVEEESWVTEHESISHLEESEEEDEDDPDTGRGRFRQERVIHPSPRLKSMDIPESLDSVRVYTSGEVVNMRGRGRAKMQNRQRQGPGQHNQAQNTGRIGTQFAKLPQTTQHKFAPGGAQKNLTMSPKKILLNPHFRGPAIEPPQGGPWMNQQQQQPPRNYMAQKAPEQMEAGPPPFSPHGPPFNQQQQTQQPQQQLQHSFHPVHMQSTPVMHHQPPQHQMQQQHHLPPLMQHQPQAIAAVHSQRFSPQQKMAVRPMGLPPSQQFAHPSQWQKSNLRPEAPSWPQTTIRPELSPWAKSTMHPETPPWPKSQLRADTQPWPWTYGKEEGGPTWQENMSQPQQYPVPPPNERPKVWLEPSNKEMHGGMPPPQWLSSPPGGPQPYLYHEGQPQFMQQPPQQQQQYEGLQMPQQVHNQPPPRGIGMAPNVMGPPPGPVNSPPWPPMNYQQGQSLNENVYDTTCYSNTNRFRMPPPNDISDTAAFQENPEWFPIQQAPTYRMPPPRPLLAQPVSVRSQSLVVRPTVQGTQQGGRLGRGMPPSGNVMLSQPERVNTRPEKIGVIIHPQRSPLVKIIPTVSMKAKRPVAVGIKQIKKRGKEINQSPVKAIEQEYQHSTKSKESSGKEKEPLNEEPSEVDINYLKKVEEQRKKREEFLRCKAEARRLAAISRLEKAKTITGPSEIWGATIEPIVKQPPIGSELKNKMLSKLNADYTPNLVQTVVVVPLATEKMTESQEGPTYMAGQKKTGENKTPMPAASKTSKSSVESYSAIVQKPITPEQQKKPIPVTQQKLKSAQPAQVAVRGTSQVQPASEQVTVSLKRGGGIMLGRGQATKMPFQQKPGAMRARGRAVLSRGVFTTAPFVRKVMGGSDIDRPGLQTSPVQGRTILRGRASAGQGGSHTLAARGRGAIQLSQSSVIPRTIPVAGLNATRPIGGRKVVLGSPAGVTDTLARTSEGDLASHNQRAVLVTNLSTSVTKEKLLTLVKNMHLEDLVMMPADHSARFIFKHGYEARIFVRRYNNRILDLSRITASLETNASAKST